MAALLPRPTSSFTIVATGDYCIGTGSWAEASTIAVHLLSASFVGSISVRARSLAAQKADPTGVTAIPVATVYKSFHLNGSAGDGTLASTAITGTSLIGVPSSGFEITLVCTAYTSGTMTVYATPTIGTI